MKFTTIARPAIAGVTVAALGLVLAGPVGAVGAAPIEPAPADTHSNRGIPTVLDPTTDLGVHTQDPSVAGDSIYITGFLKAEGHEFSYLVQMLSQPATGAAVQSFVLIDETTKWYKTYEKAIPADQVSWATDGRLQLHTPDLDWTGDAKHQELTVTTPIGALDIDLHATEPALYYGGTGAFPLLGVGQKEYALPQLGTTGRLTIQGRSRHVTGSSWVDRQWSAPMDLTRLKWTWMSLEMPNGDAVGVWNALPTDGRKMPSESWATVRHPDGSHEVVAVEPLAEAARGSWTSPESGQRYATRWTVRIPSLDTTLDVKANQVAQETNGPIGSRYEGTGTFAGAYDGNRVTGDVFLEQVGDWTP